MGRGGGLSRRAAACLVLAWVAAAALAPFLAPASYASQDLEHRLEGPSARAWMGTDDLGRDVLSRALHGARVSLAVTAAALAIALAAGTLLGAAAGYWGGLLDHVLGRTVDALLALPGILLAIAVVAYVGRGFAPLVVALSATAWVGYARVARALALSLRGRDFVTASLASGAGGVHVLRRHILPHALGILWVQAAAGAASVMLAEAGLSFLGLGIQPPHPSWGEMLATGCDYLLEAPHLALAPGALLFSAVWALNTLGEALSEGMDPGGRHRVDAV
ncbi:MAG: ABC transporter permease [Acidobacteriota bacterium]